MACGAEANAPSSWCKILRDEAEKSKRRIPSGPAPPDNNSSNFIPCPNPCRKPGKQTLEFEPERHLQLARRLCGVRPAEQRRAHHTHIVLVIHVIQRVECIHAKFHAGRFRNLENSELLAKVQIDVGIAGSAPRISSHAGGAAIHNVVMIFVFARGYVERYARAQAHDRAGLET